MRRIVTISYTDLDATGGVPKFNRDIHAAFPDRECKHFCWTDFPWHPEVDERGETEWGRARILNDYLVKSRLISSDDVVIADGFWAAGLEHLPLAVSHSHGIWSHLTKDDVDAGKQPDMPYHHAAQVAFRQRWIDLGKHITAVSEFIAEQMKLQWGFIVERVINNGVDTEIFRPLNPLDGSEEKYLQRGRVNLDKPVIVHGINDKTNTNKGWDHIELLQKFEDWDVLSLDEFSQKLGISKPDALPQATLMVHPSGYEGNSMFVAESMACGLPVVGYDVGFLWSLRNNGFVGQVLPLAQRNPKLTFAAAIELAFHSAGRYFCSATVRNIALKELSISKFRQNWNSYVTEIEVKHGT